MADLLLKSGAGALEMQNRVWAIGDKMVPAFADGTTNVVNGQKAVWDCTTGGTSNGTPTWPSSAPTYDSTTVTQNGVVWTARKPGYSSGSTMNWAYATIFTKYLAAAMAAGDRGLVSNNHNQTVNGTNTISFPGTAANPCQLICVDDSATPPTATATTAVENTGNGAYPMTINGWLYVYGMTMKTGVGSVSSAATMSLAASSADAQVWESCVLGTGTTHASAYIICGSPSGVPSLLRLINTDLLFSNTAQTLHVVGETASRFEWLGGALASGSSAITTLIAPLGGRMADATIMGVDLSAAATALNIINVTNNSLGHVVVEDCKMPASWSGGPTTGTNNAYPAMVEMYNCDSGATNYKLWLKGGSGEVKDETTIVKTGGSSDGVTPASYKMVSAANAHFPGHPLQLPLFIRNDTVGTSVTVTLDICHDSVSNLTDKDFWITVIYLGSSASPKGSRISSRANAMATGSALASSSATWTTTGMSNPNKQKASVTFTPQLAGWYLMHASLGLPSKTVYADGLPVLS